MASKAKVADVNDAFGLVDTMSVGDLFTKKPKKNSHKAKETGAKKARMTSTKEAASAHLASTLMASPDISDSQLQGKSRFYAEYICLSSDLVHEQCLVMENCD
jgi:hypothetical protein